MNEKYLSDHVTITSYNKLTCLRVSNKCASATIFTQGAHITEYTPANKHNVLFISAAEPYEMGSAIRGGIPICWPWFGPHESTEAAPAHGLVREIEWEFEIVSDFSNRTDIRFWTTTDGTQLGFPYKAKVELLVSIGSTLVVSLNTTNLDSSAFRISSALHTYFSCDDIGEVTLQGLTDATVINKLTNKSHDFPKNFRFDQETDWLVFDQGGPIAMVGCDNSVVKMNRIGSRSVVVWNPWIEKSKKLSHFSAEEYRHMFCVETSNVGEDARLIKPNTSHAMILELAPLSVDD